MAKRKKDNEDQPDENLGNADDSADNFGLPDIEYQPLNREENVVIETQNVSVEPEPEPFEEEKPVEEPTQDYAYDEDEERSKAPLIISLIIGLVVVAAGFLLYKYVYVPKQEKDRIEQARLADEKKKADEDARIAREKEEAERKRLEAEAALKAKPAAGTIETLSSRTRRFYVVVSSDIDDDLIMDYAKKLSSKGVSSKIIPPYGVTKFFRLAIADFDSFGAAQSSADGFKTDYGNGLWVIRY
jgi:hypothetical protein